MNIKKKTIGTLLLSFGILTSGGVLGSSSVLAAPVYTEQAQEIYNFGEDYESAKIWINQHLKPLYKSMHEESKDPKKLMDFYTYFGVLINQNLRENMPVSEEGMSKFLRENKPWPVGSKYSVEEKTKYCIGFDQLFQKEIAKLPSSMVLYRRVDGETFRKGLKLDATKVESWDKETIDKDTFANFKKEFEHKVIKHLGYTSTSIVEDPLYEVKDMPVLIELSAPKGTRALFIDNAFAEIVFPRNTSYILDEISLFQEKKNGYRNDGIKVKAHVIAN
ncbi:ADP-ribosyltransferase [Bacillus cereus]|nr:ADP-ribosyltransferase [Bacillus cereus]